MTVFVALAVVVFAVNSAAALCIAVLALRRARAAMRLCNTWAAHKDLTDQERATQAAAFQWSLFYSHRQPGLIARPVRRR